MKADSSGVAVRASVQEAATLHGIDGRVGEGYHCAYGVEYRLVACADGRWRIAQARLLSKRDLPAAAQAGAAPGAGMVDHMLTWLGVGQRDGA